MAKRPVTNKMRFTHGDPPAPWNPSRPVHCRGAGRGGLAHAEPASLGNMDLDRLSSFNQGVNESYDRRAKTTLKMAGVFIGVRTLQHWRQRWP